MLYALTFARSQCRCESPRAKPEVLQHLKKTWRMLLVKSGNFAQRVNSDIHKQTVKI